MTAEDKKQWLRLFNLIVKMRQLVLDFDKISIYKFEKFYAAQYRVFAKQLGQVVDEPLNAADGKGGQAANPNRRIFARRVVDPVQKVASKLGIAQNSTFTRSYKCIEGYLGKEVESRRFKHNQTRHLRYFRILFSTGKLNIKFDKEAKKMRSLLLKDMYKLQIGEISTEDKRSRETSGNKMLSWDEIRNSEYMLNDVSKGVDWLFSFEIFFPDRSFLLYARTRFEFEEWIRVFKIVSQMNKIDCSMLDQNPYFFED